MVVILKNIGKTFKKHRVFENVSLEIRKNSLITFVGPNGVGKTTLLKVIAGILHKDEGNIFFDTKEIFSTKESFHSLAFFVSESTLMENLTGREHLLLLPKEQKERTEKLIEYFVAHDLLKKKVKSYSLGMKQILLIILTCSFDVPILIFDEILNGLDPINRRKAMNLLLKLKKEKIIFLSSHQLMEVSEVSDEIYFLHDEGLEKLEEEIDSMSLESLYLEKITEGLDEAEIDF
ncbi:ABC-2 type transport system ATP-binding protein [Pilibacter termitis]|uniref:ABC-2 type transport system ATP-binding protein n=1 Tax=Pilibacter termitis TaxID=263852 RepID=A0A1T4PIE1_9ENTE|nr:ATP-binding cassette domain-containing protein [Pilibacter termitis]SJZ91314.1 ABC-2 type transport system ATP-binding protein [Pilibacter termitis]